MYALRQNVPENIIRHLYREVHVLNGMSSIIENIWIVYRDINIPPIPWHTLSIWLVDVHGGQEFCSYWDVEFDIIWEELKEIWKSHCQVRRHQETTYSPSQPRRLESRNAPCPHMGTGSVAWLWPKLLRRRLETIAFFVTLWLLKNGLQKF